MKQLSVIDRILLLFTAILAAYQIAVGIDGADAVPLWAYTTGFGVLLLAGLLLLIFGFDCLKSPLVVVVSTLIPLALSVGLVWEYLPGWRAPYALFAGAGFGLVVLTRLARAGRGATITLALVHGVAGLTIFGLPLLLSLRGDVAPGFALVGIGGGLIGLGGLLLLFLKLGRPVLSPRMILTVLPALLLLTLSAFVAGFAAGA